MPAASVVTSHRVPAKLQEETVWPQTILAGELGQRMAALELGPGVTDRLGTEEIIVEIGGFRRNLQAIKSRST